MKDRLGQVQAVRDWVLRAYLTGTFGPHPLEPARRLPHKRSTPTRKSARPEGTARSGDKHCTRRSSKR